MITWADAAGVVPPGKTLDRDAGEGPSPRCCERRFVAADALVFFGDITAATMALVVARFVRFKDDTAAEVWLCDACRETLRREQVIARSDMPLTRPLSLPDVL